MSSPLQRIAELVARESGIRVRETGDRSFASAAARAAPGMDPEVLLQAISSGREPELLRRLIDEVTVSETFFFRHPEELIALDWHALLHRSRAAGSAKIRVWVTACASGEEAYTLAILASEALGSPSCPVTILATDISGAALADAERGVYGVRSNREVPPALRTRYFVECPNGLAVGDALRGMVRFARHNLVRDRTPPSGAGPFELITCRNVLIYFGPETAQQTVVALGRSLAPGGELILGAADRISAPSPPASRPPTRARSAARSRRLGGRIRDRARRDEPGRVAYPAGALSDGSGVHAAVQAADAGRLAEAIKLAGHVLELEPLNPDALFVRGLAELGAGDAPAAVASLRRALYARPDFGLAAFHLARALERCGEHAAAGAAYKQTLRMLDRQAAEDPTVPEHGSASDVAAACRLQLRTLATTVQTGNQVAARVRR
jgi:chemotaxis protein methyltransferase CheR